MTETLESALAWHAAGCSIVPVAGDGTKRPAISWKAHQVERADADTVAYWFDTSHSGPAGPDGWGIGVVCGAVSGQLEMLEFEGRAVTEGLPARMRTAMDDHGQADLWATLIGGYLEATPSGGLHLLYRVADGQARPNTKLARRPGAGNTVEVLIETRGEGGFVVVAPTPGHCHPTGRAWTTIVGTPATIPAITAEQRDTLHAIATLLDAMPAYQPAENMPGNMPGTPGYAPGSRPGDDYNAKASWDELLGGRGWTRMWRLGDGWGWRRPGKNDRSISATTGTSGDGVDRLYVFSTSVDLPTEQPISKFAYYALTEHAGDYTAAAKALGGQGYGEPPTQARPPVQISGPPPPPSPPPRRLAAVPDIAEPEPVEQQQRPRTLRHSDDGNACALIDLHGQNIRYDCDRGRWLAWTGKRWDVQPPGGGLVRELAKDTAYQMPTGSKAADEWRKRSLSSAGVSATLVMASTDPRAVIRTSQLDANPRLLGTPAGTVELATGRVRAADPADLITRTTTVAPDFGPVPQLWTDFLNTTFGGDADLIGYIQRLAGLALIGEVLEQILPFFYGHGANGKSTLLDVMQAVLGTSDDGYATSVPSEILMVRRHEGHPTELAQLVGRRLVVASELEDGQRLAEARVKLITGRDMISARFLYGQPFTFTPSHLVVLAGNHKPQAAVGGPALWRRIRAVPFGHTVPEDQRDPTLPQRLAAVGGHILAWAIRGAADYLAGGIRTPAAVLEATREYEQDQDTIGRFLSDRVHIGGNARIAVKEMYSAYTKWCEATGDMPVTVRRLTQELAGRFGIQSVKGTKGLRVYVGAVLYADDDEDNDPVTEADRPW